MKNKLLVSIIVLTFSISEIAQTSCDTAVVYATTGTNAVLIVI